MPSALAQLGFVVFMVDGRGTPERGKAFRDVVYENPGRIEISDHVATLKQLSKEHPYMDLSRVGMFGLSIGGYMTTRAMLLAPDVYHVGVSSAASQDAGVGFLLYYFGVPQDNKQAYEYTSNLWLAGKLKGKLLLIHGTNDYVVPLSETMKMVDALVRAGKPFDLLILPGQGHNLRGTSPYWGEAHRRYFQEHLKP
jgi:dipeptidyl aminopeptidase/acylaminoacyl peptidase